MGPFTIVEPCGGVKETGSRVERQFLNEAKDGTEPLVAVPAPSRIATVPASPSGDGTTELSAALEAEDGKLALKLVATATRAGNDGSGIHNQGLKVILARLATVFVDRHVSNPYRLGARTAGSLRFFESFSQSARKRSSPTSVRGCLQSWIITL